MLRRDPVASADAFKAFMEPLIWMLGKDLGCKGDEAYDSAIDALLTYLRNPERYDHNKGRLLSFLSLVAKRAALDRRRSATKRQIREKNFSAVVELRAAASEDGLLARVEAAQMAAQVETIVDDPKDRKALELILMGERDTERLAEALGISDLPAEERRNEVKRHRDRLMATLKRMGKE
jgi:RNA polymerase sigma-70 factor (ECF subfamily)